MMLDLVEELAKLALIGAVLYVALGALARGGRAAWSAPLPKRGLASLMVLVFLVAAIEVAEEALGGGSGPIDRAALLYIRQHVPGAVTGFFEAVSFTGSAAVLLPLTIVATVAFLLARRRFEALLLAASVTSGAVVVYVVKTATGRARPSIWPTDWYWGSSFPSGHTLVVTAFATAASLCVGRVWPVGHKVALSAAFLWVFLVGLSRLVLGAHWPTDVLAAACVGACIPLAMAVAFEPQRA